MVTYDWSITDSTGDAGTAHISVTVTGQQRLFATCTNEVTVTTPATPKSQESSDFFLITVQSLKDKDCVVRSEIAEALGELAIHEQ
jgi:hypothetical protein